MSENEQQSSGLFLLGSSHRTAPLEVRERFSLTPQRIVSLYREIKHSGHFSECVVLNTCNRVEIYGVSQHNGAEGLLYEILEKEHGIAEANLRRYGFMMKDEAVIRHAFEVAAGLDSQMVGETEILGQIKASYAAAAELAATGPMLNRIFQKSFQAAKWARTHTRIGHGQISVGNIAVELAGRVCGELADVSLLLAGTGEAGQKTAQALTSRGARQITVVSRNAARARTVADVFGAAAGAMTDLERFLPHCDVIIGSTVTQEPVLMADQLKPILRRRPARPFFLIDLGVPRNFDAALARLSNVYLYNLDDLSAIANENLKARLKDVEVAREGLGEKALLLWERMRQAVSSGD